MNTGKSDKINIVKTDKINIAKTGKNKNKTPSCIRARCFTE